MLLYNDDLRTAHTLKEWFYEICQEEKYSIQRISFWDWIKAAEKSGIAEFEKCAKTYRTWSKGILNAFKYKYTNGPTEGFNNKIKVLKRTCYGIRNFKRFRTRILHCTNQYEKMTINREAFFACPKTYVIKQNIKIALCLVMKGVPEEPTPTLDKEPKKPNNR